MCDFLGIDFDVEMLDPYQEGYRRMTEGINTESRMLGDVKFHGFKKIEAGVADAWKDSVKQDFLSESTWSLAENMGYQRLGGSANPETAEDDLAGLNVDDMDEAALDAAIAAMQDEE